MITRCTSLVACVSRYTHQYTSTSSAGPQCGTKTPAHNHRQRHLARVFTVLYTGTRLCIPREKKICPSHFPRNSYVPQAHQGGHGGDNAFRLRDVETDAAVTRKSSEGNIGQIITENDTVGATECCHDQPDTGQSSRR